MKKFAIPFVFCALLGLTGCGDYVTPKGVVLTAAIAVKQNDMSSFKKAFGGKALAEFGSLQGMAAIDAKLSSMAAFSVENAKLLKVKPVTNNGFQTSVKTYSVGVDAKVTKDAAYSRVMTAMVNCDVYSVANDTCGVSGSQSVDCQMNQGGNFSTEDFTECKIVDLK